MTATLATIAACHPNINVLGAKFMLDPDTAAHGKSLGFSGASFYVTGRGGVLGDVHPDVVAAAFAYMERGAMAKWWGVGTAVMPARQAGDVYTEQCHRWARAHLAGFHSAGRLAELLQKVAASADPAGNSLFAAWRGQPLPDDDAAAAAQLTHVVRELRGGLHVMAILVSGLTPLEAMVAKSEGKLNRMWGWDEASLPDVEPLRARRAEAEKLTDRLCVPAYSVLSPAEGDELAALLQAAVAHLG